MNKKKIIICSIAIVLLLVLITFLTSYAYWKTQRKQQTTNKGVSACLKIQLEEDASTVIGVGEDAYPMSDVDGINSEPYRFSITNTCTEPLQYQIVLDSVDIADSEDRIDPIYIKLQFDDNGARRYGELDSVPIESQPDYVAIASKNLNTETLQGGETKNHTLKLWLSEDAPLSVREKVFGAKIKVYSGQELDPEQYLVTPGDCFDFDPNTGTVTGYHYEQNTACGSALIFPATIDGVLIKHIGDNFMANEAGVLSTLDFSNAVGLETIGDRAFSFYGRTLYTKTLVIPDSVKEIGNSAFQLFDGEKIILGKSVETIGEGAFNRFTGTKGVNGKSELIIPDSVKTIGVQAFSYFDGSNLELGNNLTTIGQGAFGNYEGTGQTLTIPASVTQIDIAAVHDFNETD